MYSNRQVSSGVPGSRGTFHRSVRCGDKYIVGLLHKRKLKPLGQ